MLTPRVGAGRLSDVRDRMDDDGIETLVVASSQMRKGSIRYLSNYGIHFGEAYCVVPRDEEPTLFVFSPLQREKAREQGWISDVRMATDLEEQLPTRVRGSTSAAGTIGLEQIEDFSVDIYHAIVGAVDEERIERTDMVSRERTVKSEVELDLIRESAAVADEAFRVVEEMVEPGVNEEDVYAEVERTLVRNGAPYSFNIIDSGPRPTALSFPSDRELEAGDHLAIEITPAYRGYFSQLCRIVPVSEFSDSYAAKRDAWRSTMDAGREALVPGTRLSDLFDRLDGLVESAGYSMLPRGGHGIGLDVDERPSIAPSETDATLQPGMVLAVHPSVSDDTEDYLAADTYVVTESGAERLNSIEP